MEAYQALLNACQSGDLETIERLYETGMFTSMWSKAKGISMSVDSSAVTGETIAHVAAGHGHLNILMFLKDKGVPLEKRRHDARKKKKAEEKARKSRGGGSGRRAPAWYADY